MGPAPTAANAASPVVRPSTAPDAQSADTPHRRQAEDDSDSDPQPSWCAGHRRRLVVDSEEDSDADVDNDLAEAASSEGESHESQPQDDDDTVFIEVDEVDMIEIEEVDVIPTDAAIVERWVPARMKSKKGELQLDFLTSLHLLQLERRMWYARSGGRGAILRLRSRR